MTIGSITGTNNMQAGRSGMNMQMDSVSKNIQNQIASLQKQLQELSSNEDMTLEEKMKKRQEIQQEINTLNQQLRQHQIEQKKEQQSKDTSIDDMLNSSYKMDKTKSDNKGSTLSQVNMEAMISADSSVKQSKVQGKQTSQMEGNARVLKSEIEMDKGKGGNTEKKEKGLIDLQARIEKTTQAQLSTLAEANKTMKEASQTSTIKTTESEEDTDKNRKDEETTEDTTSIETMISRPVAYTPIDVCL